jgi:hypothetical protein
MAAMFLAMLLVGVTMGASLGDDHVLVAIHRRCPSRNVKTAHRVCQFGIGGLAGFNLTFHKGEKGSRQ